MKAIDRPAVVNGSSPRLQIFRGLPGCGMESAAKEYPCLHLDENLLRYSAGRYAASIESDGGHSRAVVERNFIVLVKGILKKGIDVVLSGTFARPESTFGWIVYYAMCSGYEVWIQDFLNPTDDTVRQSWQDIERCRNEFTSYEPELFGERFNRFSPVREDIHPSKDDCAALAEYSVRHIHKGRMANDYPVA